MMQPTLILTAPKYRPGLTTDLSNFTHRFFRRASWDFFSSRTGAKAGFITEISKTGCLLQACEEIDSRRWVRILLQDETTCLAFSIVGRVTRIENALDYPDGEEATLYRYTIEFTHPTELRDEDLARLLGSAQYPEAAEAVLATG